MWLVSAFCHPPPAPVPSLLSSALCQSVVQVQRTFLGGRRLSLGGARVPQARLARTARLCAKSGTVGDDMVPEDAAALLRAVYSANPTPQICLTTTGSGGQAVSWLLGVPGASACLLEATVPYSKVACKEKMQAGPPAPGFCSREAAEGLARDAYARAVSLCVRGSSQGMQALATNAVVGVGCTAAVVSSHPKRGPHQCFVCVQAGDALTHYHLELIKGRRDRDGEDSAVSRVILQGIAEASGIDVSDSFKGDHLHPPAWDTMKGESDRAGGDTVATEVAPVGEIAEVPDAVDELVKGGTDAVLIVPRDTRDSQAPGSLLKSRLVAQVGAVKAALPRESTVILPGSYNPLHKGHVGLMRAARTLHAEKLQSESEVEEHSGRLPMVHTVFEVSVSNPDKGVLAADEVRRRICQFSEDDGVGWPYPVVVTRAPLFSQKARLFPGCAFVVGADTAKRIVDPKYYEKSEVAMVAALAEIKHLGCSFIVGGRAGADGQFLTLNDVLEGSVLPDSLRGMFHGLDESTFREDLSSTSIRAGTAQVGL